VETFKSYQANKILLIPYQAFNNNWKLLQNFVKKLGNPNYGIIGDVNLSERKDISSLTNLVSVYGNLDLYKSSITNLGSLEYVSNTLYLARYPLNSLGKLKYVGGMLNICESKINDLGCLEYVGKSLITYKSGVCEEQLNAVRIDGKIII
jgi:hypothetical protein